MALDIFFSEDIRNALLAADEASTSMARMCSTAGDPVTLRAYLGGYRAALTTVALAFGLSPAIIQGSCPEQMEPLEVEARTVEGANVIAT